MRHYEIMVILDASLEERTVAPSLDTYLNVIRTAGDQNGIYQFFGGGSYYSGAWIYALTGAAEVGVVPGAYGVSTLLDQWEFVQPGSPIAGNEFIIYSNGVNGADFYVDLAVVDSNRIIPESVIPEPSSLRLLLLGAVSIFAGRGFRLTAQAATKRHSRAPVAQRLPRQ